MSTPSSVGSESGRTSRMVDWWFRDRSTGRIVVGQFPNAALWVWGACFAIQAFGSPTGDFALLVRGAGRAALLVWALDELARGCNPFRRVLGVVVLLITVPTWIAG